MENNIKINEKIPKIHVTTTINQRVWSLAKEHNIIWGDALEFGIIFKLAEMDLCEYPPNRLSDNIIKLNDIKDGRNNSKTNTEN